MAGCGMYALIGFPLDDVWHRIFGQDVTLWARREKVAATINDTRRNADYLPDTSDIRRSALVELIRVDLQQRWLRAGTGSGVGKRLTDYCDEFPDLPRATLPAAIAARLVVPEKP